MNIIKRWGETHEARDSPVWSGELEKMDKSTGSQKVRKIKELVVGFETVKKKSFTNFCTRKSWPIYIIMVNLNCK